MTEYQWVSATYLKHVKPLFEAYEAKVGEQEKDKRGIKKKVAKH